MAEKKVNKARIIMKHDTEENWLKATNFIPLDGEVIVYDTDATNTVPRMKIGDGVTKVNALPFTTEELKNKVDKVAGKGLSTNDYSNNEKQKVADTSDNLSAHIANKSNPHAVTAAQVGLGNVENKSSATIRGELTKANVTNALGYTPPTTNTTYSAGTGISISTANAISNTGVRSVATGTANGTISVNTNGTTANVAVKGLGSAAYTASTAYDAAGAANSALASAKTYADEKVSAIKYAGSSSAGGAATSANKINTDAGSSTQPVYFSNGVPVGTTYALNASVPSNAAFTDTKVQQNAAITTAGEYPVLLGYSTETSQVTNAVQKTSTLKYNPSTQILTAPTFSGALTGNATTATKATQDGSGNTITSTYATKSELNTVSGLVGSTAVSTQISNAVAAKAPTSHASTATTYGAASASNYGHAMASSTTPKANGTATVGSETAKFARGDHIHPLQTTVSGNAGSATKLATARNIDGVSFTGEANVTRYAACSTAAGTAAKTASITAGTFSLITGARVTVKFTNANSAASPTLNIGSTGAKAIYWQGSALASSQYWQAGAVLDFVYNGTQWDLIGVAKDNNTTYSTATTSANGLMSSTDKTTLNNLSTLVGSTAVSTQISNAIASKQNTITGAATTITGSNLTANRALVSNGDGKVAVSSVTSTELGYLSGATSSVQTQLNGKVPTSRTINGKALSSNITLSASDVGADSSGAASAALTSATTYTQTQISNLNIGKGASTGSVKTSHATSASGNYSFAEGRRTTASGSASHAEGQNTTASGDSSHAEGNSSTASGSTSHAEGSNTVASGDCSHAEGSFTTASGRGSHAEGDSTTAKGNYSHTGGQYTIVKGSHGVAIGKYNLDPDSDENILTTKSNTSHSFYSSSTYKTTYTQPTISVEDGTVTYTNTSSLKPDQFQIGMYVINNTVDEPGYFKILSTPSLSSNGYYYHANVDSYLIKLRRSILSTYAFSVGNGVSEYSRSNAHTLDWSGNAWFKGKVYTGGTSKNDANAKQLATQEYVNGKVPKFTYSTTDLEAGVSSLAEGTVYFVYE